ncbi:hypothetical protein [Nocardia stercoris]|uniref:hypothetical protein n=1 Tax=Nocardia stercoris TaxID=2483361 RepID=UPI001F2E4A1B|nr:hypothetical protein [Nocardia stercoris]
MSDKSSQLSVAELIARNGGKNAQASSSGRRRRGGRGISVSELTGDLPVVPEGNSSHAGPASDTYPAPDGYAPEQSPVSGPITYFDPLAESRGGRRTPPPSDAQWQAPPAAPQWQAPAPEPQWTPPEPPARESGRGGRRSRAEQPAPQPGYGPSTGGFEAPAAGFTPPAAPASGGRRARREQREALEQQLAGGVPAAEPAPARGGRRRRKDDDEPGPADLLGYSGGAAPTWTPPREPEPQQAWAPPQDPRQNGWTPPRPEPQRGPQPPQRGPEPQPPRGPAPQALREPQPPQPRGPEPKPPLPPRDSGRSVRELPAEQQPPRGRGDRSGPALPAWSARRRVDAPPQQRPDLPVDDTSGEPTAVWSLAALDRQARSGGPVRGADERGPEGGRGRGGRDNRRRGDRAPVRDAGPELDGVEEQPRSRRDRRAQRDEPNGRVAHQESGPAPERGPHAGRGNRGPRDDQDPRGRGGRAPEDHDDLHDHDERGGRGGWSRPAALGAGRRGGRPEQPPLAESRTELFEPVGAEPDEDFDNRSERPRRPGPKNGRKSPPGKGQGGKPRSRADESMRRLAVSDRVARRSKAARGAGAGLADRPWTMLGLQVAGAAVAGMLMFKGFEKMWDVLPFVALALAVVVILGLVALVRVLRRSDDIFSTVMAVLVGSFVTLGPLAFMLSTN